MKTTVLLDHFVKTKKLQCNFFVFTKWSNKNVVFIHFFECLPVDHAFLIVFYTLAKDNQIMTILFLFSVVDSLDYFVEVPLFLEKCLVVLYHALEDSFHT